MLSSGVMFDPLSSNLERYMDLLSARQKLVVSNIANADTPGYKTRDIDFQFDFATPCDGEPAARARRSDGLKTKNDGNNVNIDRESRLLSENAYAFQHRYQSSNRGLKLIRSAIEGGSDSDESFFRTLG